MVSCGVRTIGECKSARYLSAISRRTTTGQGVLIMSLEELKEEAFRLGPDARAYLARELVASLEGMTDAEIEALWIDEAIRRDTSLHDGSARAFPAGEVLARVRTRRT